MEQRFTGADLQKWIDDGKEVRVVTSYNAVEWAFVMPPEWAHQLAHELSDTERKRHGAHAEDHTLVVEIIDDGYEKRLHIMTELL